jgi:dUTP pyrophosphatase
MTVLAIKKVHPDAIIPEYAKPGDAGMDLFSVEEKTLKPLEIALINTGIALQLPEEKIESRRSYEAQIRPRSGLALKHGITILNSPGTIDQGYRGEIKVILINLGKEDFTVTKGMKIAQMVITRVIDAIILEVDELNPSERGENGFGSTGLKAVSR